MVSVRLENLSKYFGKVKAVENLNLTVKDGEFLTFLGPSGCGKTTILRCIAGLESPTSGQVYFDDKIVNDLSPRERNVAMVFQSYALYPHMSVYDNIAFLLMIKKIPKDEIDRRVKEMAEFLHIEKALDRKPLEISGGERQRVALARALYGQPSLIVLDEPNANLDDAGEAALQKALATLKTMGKTVVVISHRPGVLAVADRIVLMRDGRVVDAGERDAVLRRLQGAAAPAPSQPLPDPDDRAAAPA